MRLADSGGNTGDRGQTNAENKLFVGGVPAGCGDKDLRALFSMYGEVLDVYILASKASQEGQRGCAFVRYASPQSCAIAIEALHGKYAMKAGELPLVVRFADPPKNQRGNASGGYANGAFHCLLVCPCGGGHGAKCDHASHKHCPGKSRCARGELRKMDLGVCTYDAVDA